MRNLPARSELPRHLGFPPGFARRCAPRGPSPGRLAWTRIYLLVGWVFISMLLGTAAANEALTPVLVALQNKDYQAAADALIELDDRSEIDLSLEMIKTARDGKKTLDAKTLDALYTRAAEAVDANEPTAKTAEQRALVRSVAVIHFSARHQYDAASKTLVAALQEADGQKDGLSDQRIRQLVQLGVKTAWAALSDRDAESAERLYAGIVDRSIDDRWAKIIGDDHARIMLGLGWATAMQPDRSAKAAEHLGAFLDRFPDHEDAPTATSLRIRCLKSANQNEQAAELVGKFWGEWPLHDTARQLAFEALSTDPSQHSVSLKESLHRWIVEQGDPQDWSPELARRALLYTGAKLPPPRFDALLRHLASLDETGQQTAVLLQESTDSGSKAIAEQVAATLISGDLSNATKMSRESACRWAGRSGHWSMLALAAESTDLSVTDEQRTVHVDRLFAEALTRTGQGRRAATWWAHVVDQRGADDFATLLRCAECAVAHSDLAEASRRLDAVNQVIAQSGSSSSSVRAALVQLLSAELAIRSVDFARARTLFEKVVRNPSATAALRGRAQWMIGETFFMQQQYAEAINSYRKVDGLDPGGPFVAASLVQAGKSFEQLGLTREAADCYSALLGRFADSTHAREARSRMAMLPQSSASPSPPGSPNETPPPNSRVRSRLQR